MSDVAKSLKTNRVHNGRTVTGATAWWDNNRQGAWDLYCVHSINLDAVCRQCQKENGGK